MRKFVERAVRFFRQVWSELRRVVWPTRRQAIVFTGIVVATVTVIAAIIWLVDSIVGSILGLVIG